MLLAVDIGNSNIVVGGLQDGKILWETRIETQQAAAPGWFAARLQEAMARYGVSPAELEDGIISSVVPPVLEAVRRSVAELTGQAPLVVGPELETGLTLQVDNPAQVGSDRIVIAVAALERYQPPLILIDMGTATTIEAVGPGSVYLGGCILPGVQVSQDALSERAALLPAIQLGPPGNVIGKNTVDCMRSGAMYGAAATLDGLVDRVEEELGAPAVVVATGGIAQMVVPLCRRTIVLENDLLLRGLDLLYRMNRRR